LRRDERVFKVTPASAATLLSLNFLATDAAGGINGIGY
jgi:hypothetical protein